MEIVSEKYQSWLEKQKRDYKSSQVKAAVAVNAEMLKFYWALGADIVRMEPVQPWGSKFMQHLNDDLRREMPDGGCFSRINLYYMKWFCELYCMRSIVPQVGEQLQTLGNGTCEDIKRCYLVIEVKVRKFRPADVGQINAYMSAVNHRFRKDGDGPTIGLIICKEKDRITAQYALEDVNKPIGIADYALEKFVPPDFISDLPTVDEIETDQTRRLQILLGQKEKVGRRERVERGEE